MDEESDYKDDVQDFRPPPVTLGLISLCLAVFLGQSITGLDGSPFYVSGVSFWAGQYYGLFSSFFVHIVLIQLALNVLVLWRLGSVMERSLGSAWFLCFWLIATCLSRLAEICVSADVGMGASGFCFAMFGFCLVAGRLLPELELEVEWVVGITACFFIFLGLSAVTGVLIGANLGHFIGFVVGCLLAYGLIERQELWVRSCVGIFLLILTVPCFYAPWSSSWHLAQAYRAYDDKQYQIALNQLDQVNLPQLQVSLLNLRAQCLTKMGKDEEAAVALKTLLDDTPEDALKIDPGQALNAYAWLLATSTHPLVWNPQAALPLADRACKETDYANGELLDTLAVAYAGTGNFDAALQWEKKALAALPTTPGAGKDDEAELTKRVTLFEEHQVYREVYK